MYIVTLNGKGGMYVIFSKTTVFCFRLLRDYKLYFLSFVRMIMADGSYEKNSLQSHIRWQIFDLHMYNFASLLLWVCSSVTSANFWSAKTQNNLTESNSFNNYKIIELEKPIWTLFFSSREAWIRSFDKICTKESDKFLLKHAKTQSNREFLFFSFFKFAPKALACIFTAICDWMSDFVLNSATPRR